VANLVIHHLSNAPFSQLWWLNIHDYHH
jgi:hypothetical protein